MESGLGAIHWLHGLEDYFIFKKEDKISELCGSFLKVLYSENKAPSLRNAIIEALQQPVSEGNIYNITNFFSHTANHENNMKLQEISSALALLFPEENLFKTINKFYRQTDLDLSDAFSRGQVQSKIWLATEIEKLKLDNPNILIFASWFGQLVNYFNFNYNKIRLVDIDRQACFISDYIFNLTKLIEYRVKSVCENIDNLNIHSSGYVLNVEDLKTNKIFEEKFLPDVIINSSAEHMNDDWFFQIKFKEMESDPIVVIQSNNLFDIPEHINCVHSVDHMKKKFPMREVLYEGEIQLKGYKRFMLIGRP